MRIARIILVLGLYIMIAVGASLISTADIAVADGTKPVPPIDSTGEINSIEPAPEDDTNNELSLWEIVAITIDVII